MAVSLSAHDRRALDLIGEGIAASDPRLAAMLSAFSRLADGEAMPGRERIRARGWRPPGEASKDMLAAGQGGRRSRMTVQRLVVLAWLGISLVLIAIALVTSHAGAAASCASPASHVCGNHMTTHRQSPHADGSMS